MINNNQPSASYPMYMGPPISLSGSFSPFNNVPAPDLSAKDLFIETYKPKVEKDKTESSGKTAVPADSAAPAAGSEEDSIQSESDEEASEKAAKIKPDDQLVKITILHTNDIHGAEDKLPAMTETLQQLKKENPDAILVDSGDIAYSAKPTENDRYAPMVDYLNNNGYSLVVPGNHDFQDGKDGFLHQFISKLEPEVLCANVLEKETGHLLPGTRSRIIKEINGVKVAFIGVTTTKMATNDRPDVGSDLIVFGEAETLQREVAQAKSEGAQVFVAIMHKGFSDVKEVKGIAKKVPEIDLMVLGHDHANDRTSIRTGEFPHRTYIVEAGSYGNNVGSVNIYIDPESKQVVKAQMKAIPSTKYSVSSET
ncbi:MAG: bifunctional metallophosphatase/5'-nucleotidase [Candidatus Xenobiia bacterium LiM19]